MKKLALLLLCLCLVCSAAYAEDAVIVLNWEEVGTEDVLAAGSFQQIDIPGLPSVLFWIPSTMAPVDVSVIEGNFKPDALYATEDQSNSMAVFVMQISSLKEFAALMESEGGGSNFHDVKINGVDCFCYTVESAGLDCMVYPVSDTVVVTLNCSPLNGDENFDAIKGVIFASLQLAK
jgi:hypothetical protein